MGKSIIKRLWENLLPILVFYFFIQVLVNFLVYWNDPTWGFAQFGIGVIFATVFLPAWLIIYYGCKISAKRRHASPIENRGSAADI